jgi:DMSO/TMAO reductase YedYZ molybdopterin-dependent catalytic subunit
MGIVSPGFHGRRRGDQKLPPGQYLVTDFPVLSAGPTPRVDTGTWRFRLQTETGQIREWDWAQFRALPDEDITVDIHCVTKWSKLTTHWRGVSLDTLLAEAETSAQYLLAHSYGGYTTNLPLADVRDGQAWIAFEYEGKPLAAEHGGPVRLSLPRPPPGPPPPAPRPGCSSRTCTSGNPPNGSKAST